VNVGCRDDRHYQIQPAIDFPSIVDGDDVRLLN
jgi:hypothetical protein